MNCLDIVCVFRMVYVRDYYIIVIIDFGKKKWNFKNIIKKLNFLFIGSLIMIIFIFSLV